MKINIIKVVVLAMLLSLNAGCRTPESEGNSILNSIMIRGKLLIGLLDTSPHFDVDKWHDYQTKINGFIMSYKIPSSDEFPDKRNSYGGGSDCYTKEFNEEEVHTKGMGIFEATFNKYTATPRYHLFCFKDTTNGKKIERYMGRSGKSFFSVDKFQCNNIKWVKFTTYFTRQKKNISSEYYATKLTDKYYIFVLGGYSGYNYFIDWKDSAKWIKDRQAVTRKVVESISIVKDKTTKKKLSD